MNKTNCVYCAHAPMTFRGMGINKRALACVSKNSVDVLVNSKFEFLVVARAVKVPERKTMGSSESLKASALPEPFCIGTSNFSAR